MKPLLCDDCAKVTLAARGPIWHNAGMRTSKPRLSSARPSFGFWAALFTADGLMATICITLCTLALVSAAVVDVPVQLWLDAHYNASLNSIIKAIGALGLGRWQVLAAFAALLVVFARTNLPGVPRNVALQLWFVFSRGLMLFGRFVVGRFAWPAPLAQWPRSAQLWLAMLPVFLLSGVAVTVLKILFGRPRPKVFLWNGHNPADLALHPFILDGTYHSFPSGHTATTFALALVVCVLLRQWGKPALAVMVWPVAVIISSARVLEVTPHYVSDVFGGAALGLLAAWVYLRASGLVTAGGTAAPASTRQKASIQK